MHSKILSFVRGYVQVELVGRHTERFINEAYSSGLAIWNVRRTSSGGVLFHTSLSSFFELRPYLRKSGCKIRVKRRHGLPFMLRRLESRLFFAVGFVFFILGIYLLSQVVWKVEVEGNEQIPYDKVVKSAELAGIRPFQWKFKLEDPNELSRKLTQTLDGAAWVGVELKGTRVLIKVVEQTIPEPKKLMNPRHLVSRYDAVVTDIFVERGRPAVRVNMKVKKGDVLVSGLVGSDENASIVVADGSVKGLVWHEYTVVSPIKHKHKVYTGEEKTRRYLVIGNRALQITGYGKLSFDQYESDVLRHALEWRKWRLPLGTIKEKLREVRVEEEMLNASEAKQVGLMQARGELLQKSGAGAKLKGEKILHEKIEGGKVYMKVLFEVEQEIAVELPIVQGD